TFRRKVQRSLKKGGRPYERRRLERWRPSATKCLLSNSTAGAWFISRRSRITLDSIQYPRVLKRLKKNSHHTNKERVPYNFRLISPSHTIWSEELLRFG